MTVSGGGGTASGACLYALCNVSIAALGGRVSDQWLLVLRFSGLLAGSSAARARAAGEKVLLRWPHTHLSLSLSLQAALVSPSPRSAAARSRGTWIWLCVAGVLSFAITALFIEALKRLPPAIVIAIVYVYPCISAVLAAGLLNEPLPAHAALSGPIALLGLARRAASRCFSPSFIHTK